VIKYFYGDDDNPVPVVQCFTKVENADKSKKESNNDNPVSVEQNDNAAPVVQCFTNVENADKSNK